MNSLDYTGQLPLDILWATSQRASKTPWPSIEVPHAGTIKAPPNVAQLPRDRRGYPVLFTVARKEKRGQILDADFTSIDPERVALCAEEKRCGVCGGFLMLYFKQSKSVKRGEAQFFDPVHPNDGHDYVEGPQRVYCIGGPQSCERTRVFNDPPMHFACALFALKACPWIILSRYKRTDRPGVVHAGPHAGAIVINRPPKLGLLQGVNYEWEDGLFFLKFPVLLGYVAPEGWPSDADMKKYFADTERQLAVKMFAEMRQSMAQSYARQLLIEAQQQGSSGFTVDVGQLITTGRMVRKQSTYVEPQGPTQPRSNA